MLRSAHHPRCQWRIDSTWAILWIVLLSLSSTQRKEGATIHGASGSVRHELFLGEIQQQTMTVAISVQFQYALPHSNLACVASCKKNDGSPSSSLRYSLTDKSTKTSDACPRSAQVGFGWSLCPKLVGVMGIGPLGVCWKIDQERDHKLIVQRVWRQKKTFDDPKKIWSTGEAIPRRYWRSKWHGASLEEVAMCVWTHNIRSLTFLLCRRFDGTWLSSLSVRPYFFDDSWSSQRQYFRLHLTDHSQTFDVP